jgi:hypothetical protein
MIAGSVGLAVTGALACPYIANAAATTATVWQVQQQAGGNEADLER